MEKFATEVQGYSKEQVNKFIDYVIRELEKTIQKQKSQEVEIQKLRKELIKYHDIEGNLSKAISQAEESKANIRRFAEKEADMLLTEARQNANRIVNEALIKAERIEMKRETLERNMRIYKRKLKAIVEQQLEIVDEIEILEL